MLCIAPDTRLSIQIAAVVVRALRGAARVLPLAGPPVRKRGVPIVEAIVPLYDPRIGYPRQTAISRSGRILATRVIALIVLVGLFRTETPIALISTNTITSSPSFLPTISRTPTAVKSTPSTVLRVSSAASSAAIHLHLPTHSQRPSVSCTCTKRAEPLFATR